MAQLPIRSFRDLGSQAELETQLELAHRLLATDVKKALELTAEVEKLLHGLVRTLEHPTAPERPSFTYSVRQSSLDGPAEGGSSR